MVHTYKCSVSHFHHPSPVAPPQYEEGGMCGLQVCVRMWKGGSLTHLCGSVSSVVSEGRMTLVPQLQLLMPCLEAGVTGTSVSLLLVGPWCFLADSGLPHLAGIGKHLCIWVSSSIPPLGRPVPSTGTAAESSKPLPG